MFEQIKRKTYKLKKIYIESELPEALKPLHGLANNLWWSWHKQAIDLFQSILPERWEELRCNPVALLDELPIERANELKNDAEFISNLQSVKAEFDAYMAQPANLNRPSVAYFCMEYGLHISLRLYSGGLGILAGDYIKEASDSNVDLIGVGLLYRYGYFEQAISLHGDQVNLYPPQKFTKMPLMPVREENGEWLKVSIDLKGRKVWAKVWEMKVGRISLYLLDADLDENDWADRGLTHQLYGGDTEHRLKQEILLGIGGMKALKAMGIEKDVYHCNEGHAAFLGLERLNYYINEDELSYEEALEVVRASSLFTTHTPVPAGHDYFTENLLYDYLSSYIHTLGIPWKTFNALGRINPDDVNEKFSMSHLAIRLSQEVNGVSKLHGSVSQKMFRVLYEGYHPEELFIGYVTNSVHYPTWISHEWHKLFTEQFGEGFFQDQSNVDRWRNIFEVSDEKVWEIRQKLKANLIEGVKKQLRADLTRRGSSPKSIFEQINSIKEDALVVGFARRFATYKRANLLFSNLDRLAKIVNRANYPVVFIFSGKAHPADTGGQALIKQIINISQQPEFLGKVIFLENYSMEIGKLMTQGVDVWLNTPTRPKEASGTSGMKAALNGVVNFSVLDGWWAEGYRPDAGWALPLERTYDDQFLQDELDAESIYNILDFEIIPTYFKRNEQGLPKDWIFYVKNIIGEVAPNFTMKRMLDDYYSKFYNKLGNSSKAIKANNFAKAKDLIKWKDWIKKQWDGIQIADIDVYDTENYSLPAQEPFKAKIKLELNQVRPEEVGIEVVFFKRQEEDELNLQFSQELELIEYVDNQATYRCEFKSNITGVFEYGFRLFPKHHWMPHRQDLNLVKWL